MVAMDIESETFADKLLGFTIPSRNARARIVRLDRAAEDVLAAHDYPAPIAHLLSEALVLTVLMGGLLKAEGEEAQLTMQAQTKTGIVSLLVCDYRGGVLRGYADFNADALGDQGVNLPLDALFGTGHLAITFETGRGQRYQGIVPLEGDTLAAACEAYFSQSEQVPTLIRQASKSGSDGRVAAGMLIQHLADGEEGRERLHTRLDHPDWEHVSTIAGTISHAELLDPDLSLEALAWRLFHEEDRVFIQPGADLRQGCRCSADYYASVLARFPAQDLNDMRDASGHISVDCAFCARKYTLEI